MYMIPQNVHYKTVLCKSCGEESVVKIFLKKHAPSLDISESSKSTDDSSSSDGSFCSSELWEENSTKNESQLQTDEDHEEQINIPSSFKETPSSFKEVVEILSSDDEEFETQKPKIKLTLIEQ